MRFNAAEDRSARRRAKAEQTGRPPHQAGRGSSAVWQARLIMLVMINCAQLWILSAAVEAALAGHSAALLPLVVSSGICFFIALSILLWWRPVSRRRTSTGYVRAAHDE